MENQRAAVTPKGNFRKIGSTKIREFLNRFREQDETPWDSVNWDEMYFQSNNDDEYDENLETIINIFNDEHTAWNMLFEEQRTTIYDPRTNLSDVHLITNEGIIPVHSLLLKGYSPFLDTLLDQSNLQCKENLITLTFSDVKLEHLKAFVNILYTGSTLIKIGDEENVKKIFESLQIEKVKFQNVNYNPGRKIKLKSVLTMKKKIEDMGGTSANSFRYTTAPAGLRTPNLLQEQDGSCSSEVPSVVSTGGVAHDSSPSVSGSCMPLNIQKVRPGELLNRKQAPRIQRGSVIAGSANSNRSNNNNETNTKEKDVENLDSDDENLPSYIPPNVVKVPHTTELQRQPRIIRQLPPPTKGRPSKRKSTPKPCEKGLDDDKENEIDSPITPLRRMSRYEQDNEYVPSPGESAAAAAEEIEEDLEVVEVDSLDSPLPSVISESSDEEVIEQGPKTRSRQLKLQSDSGDIETTSPQQEGQRTLRKSSRIAKSTKELNRSLPTRQMKKQLNTKAKEQKIVEKCFFCKGSFKSIEKLQSHLDTTCAVHLKQQYCLQKEMCHICRTSLCGYSSEDLLSHVTDCAKKSKTSSNDAINVEANISNKSDDFNGQMPPSEDCIEELSNPECLTLKECSVNLENLEFAEIPSLMEGIRTNKELVRPKIAKGRKWAISTRRPASDGGDQANDNEGQPEPESSISPKPQPIMPHKNADTPPSCSQVTQEDRPPLRSKRRRMRPMPASKKLALRQNQKSSTMLGDENCDDDSSDVPAKRQRIEETTKESLSTGQNNIDAVESSSNLLSNEDSLPNETKSTKLLTTAGRLRATLKKKYALWKNQMTNTGRNSAVEEANLNTAGEGESVSNDEAEIAVVSEDITQTRDNNDNVFVETVNAGIEEPLARVSPPPRKDQDPSNGNKTTTTNCTEKSATAAVDTRCSQSSEETESENMCRITSVFSAGNTEYVPLSSNLSPVENLAHPVHAAAPNVENTENGLQLNLNTPAVVSNSVNQTSTEKSLEIQPQDIQEAPVLQSQSQVNNSSLQVQDSVNSQPNENIGAAAQTALQPSSSSSAAASNQTCIIDRSAPNAAGMVVIRRVQNNSDVPLPNNSANAAVATIPTNPLLPPTRQILERANQAPVSQGQQLCTYNPQQQQQPLTSPTIGSPLVVQSTLQHSHRPPMNSVQPLPTQVFINRPSLPPPYGASSDRAGVMGIPANTQQSTQMVVSNPNNNLSSNSIQPYPPVHQIVAPVFQSQTYQSQQQQYHITSFQQQSSGIGSFRAGRAVFISNRPTYTNNTTFTVVSNTNLPSQPFSINNPNSLPMAVVEPQFLSNPTATVRFPINQGMYPQIGNRSNYQQQQQQHVNREQVQTVPLHALQSMQQNIFPLHENTINSLISGSQLESLPQESPLSIPYSSNAEVTCPDCSLVFRSQATLNEHQSLGLCFS